ncbi:hypothetical protein IC582_025571 [Cucumis melo]
MENNYKISYWMLLKIDLISFSIIYKLLVGLSLPLNFIGNVYNMLNFIIFVKESDTFMD